jgi:hypothetical protein
MLQEIYLLNVSKTYHMNFKCLGTFVFVGSGHVGVSMFTHESCDKFMKFDFFLWKIIHIEPLTNTINMIL